VAAHGHGQGHVAGVENMKLRTIVIVTVLIIAAQNVEPGAPPNPDVPVAIRVIDMNTGNFMEADCLFQVKHLEGHTFGYRIPTNKLYLRDLRAGDVLYLQIYADGYVPSIEKITVPYPVDDSPFIHIMEMYPRGKPNITTEVSWLDAIITIELGYLPSMVNPSQEKFGHYEFTPFGSRQVWSEPILVLESDAELWTQYYDRSEQHLDRWVYAWQINSLFRTHRERVIHLEGAWQHNINVSATLYESYHHDSEYNPLLLPRTEKPFTTFTVHNDSIEQHEPISIVNESLDTVNKIEREGWPYSEHIGSKPDNGVAQKPNPIIHIIIGFLWMFGIPIGLGVLIMTAIKLKEMRE
jgi:hypothetical protein